MLDRALALRGQGPYVLQAAIASLHADEPRDWKQIAALYSQLSRVTNSPVVELSRAVAVAEHKGLRPAWTSSIASNSPTITTYTPRAPSFFAASARPSQRATPLRRALTLVHEEAERRLLERRLAELNG